MFIDADARMDTYEDKDGVKRIQLNLLMRKGFASTSSSLLHLTTVRRQLRSAQSSTDPRCFQCRRGQSNRGAACGHWLSWTWKKVKTCQLCPVVVRYSCQSEKRGVCDCCWFSLERENIGGLGVRDTSSLLTKH